jgi:hypothetical protein
MLTCATSVPRFQNRKVLVQEFAYELKVMLLLTACPSDSHNYNNIVASCSVMPKLMGLMKGWL